MLKFINPKHAKLAYQLIFLVTAVVGVLFRVSKIFTADFFRDEAFSGLLAQKSLKDIVLISANDTNPPLYPILEHFWGAIFGFNTNSLRTLSFGFAILTFGLLIYLLHLLKFNYKLKLIILSLFILNPSLIYYAVEARYYGIVIFSSLALFTLSYKIFKLNQTRLVNWILLFFIVLFGLYNHNSFVLILLANIIIIILMLLLKTKPSDLKARLIEVIKDKSFKLFILIMAADFIIYLPWLIVLKSQLAQANQGFWLQFNPITSPLGFAIDTTIWPLNLPSPTTLVIFSNGLLLLLIVGIIYCVTKKKYQLVLAYLGLILATFYFASFKQPLFYIRYLVFVVPFSLIVISLGIFSLKKIRLVIYSLIVIISVFSLLEWGRPNKTDNIEAKRVVSYLNRDIASEDYPEVYFDPLMSHNYLPDFLKDYAIRDISEGLTGHLDRLILNEDALTYFNIEFYSHKDNYSKILGSYAQTPYYIGKALIPENRFINDLTTVKNDSIYLISSNYPTDNSFKKMGEGGYTYLYTFKFDNLYLSVFAKNGNKFYE